MTNKEYYMTIPKDIRMLANTDYSYYCEAMARHLGIAAKTMRSYVTMEEFVAPRLEKYKQDVDEIFNSIPTLIGEVLSKKIIGGV